MIAVLVGEFCFCVHDFFSILKVLVGCFVHVGPKHVADFEFKEVFGLTYAWRFSLPLFMIRDLRACLDQSILYDNKLTLGCTLLFLADGLFSYINLPTSL